jgi:hypothetical protein
MMIFDETVVDRTILLLTPLLKSAAPHSRLSLENNPERGRAQLKSSSVREQFYLRGLAILHILPSVGLGARQSA